MLLAKKRQHSTTLITDWQTFHQIEEKKNCLVCVSFALCSMVLFSVSVLFFPQRFSHSFFIAHFILLQTKKNTSLTITALKCSTSRSLDIVSLDIYSLSLFWFSQTNQMWLTFGRARIIVLVSFFARFIYFCSQCGILFAFMHFKNENNSKSTMIN